MFKFKKYIKHRRILSLSLLILEVIFFSLINPYNSQTVVLVIGIFLVILDYYFIIRYLIFYLARIYRTVDSQKYRIILFVTIPGALFIILKSLNQLAIGDILVIILLSIMGYIYMWYISNRKSVDKK